MGERKQLHLGREQRGKLFEFESPIITNWDKAEPRAGSLGQQLPGHKIAVMLHDGQENQVAFANKPSAPRLGNAINALSSPPCENDFVWTRRADVFWLPLPRIFVSFRRARAQCMQTSMHICVFVLVKIPQR